MDQAIPSLSLDDIWGDQRQSLLSFQVPAGAHALGTMDLGPPSSLFPLVPFLSPALLYQVLTASFREVSSL